MKTDWLRTDWCRMCDALRRRLSLGLVTMGVALAAGAGTAAAQALVAGSPVQLSLSTSHLGYVSAALTAPAQSQVTLTEADDAGHRTLIRVSVPASGTLTIPDLVDDSCSVLDRTIAATISSGSASGSASASVTTPACTRRLGMSAPQSGRVGAGADVTLRDHWRVGDLPVRVCVQPPGGNTRCGTYPIPAGKSERTLDLSLPRIGGWQVTTSVPGGKPQQTVVWASHPGPIRLLALGDSEMQVLDDDLTQDLAPYDVSVISDARPSTGLTNPFLYNWQSASQRLVANDKPDISIVSMGANDGYGIGSVDCCGPAWSTAYGGLVAQMARTLLQGSSAIAYWFVLATPQPVDFQRSMGAVNAGIEDAAHTLAGRLGLVNANAYFTPGNVYRNHMVVNGHGFTIHEPDGIHLDATADQYAARLVVKQLLTDRVIR